MVACPDDGERRRGKAILIRLADVNTLAAGDNEEMRIKFFVGWTYDQHDNSVYDWDAFVEPEYCHKHVWATCLHLTAIQWLDKNIQAMEEE